MVLLHACTFRPPPIDAHDMDTNGCVEAAAEARLCLIRLTVCLGVPVSRLSDAALRDSAHSKKHRSVQPDRAMDASCLTTTPSTDRRVYPKVSHGGVRGSSGRFVKPVDVNHVSR